MRQNFVCWYISFCCFLRLVVQLPWEHYLPWWARKTNLLYCLDHPTELPWNPLQSRQDYGNWFRFGHQLYCYHVNVQLVCDVVKWIKQSISRCFPLMFLYDTWGYFECSEINEQDFVIHFSFDWIISLLRWSTRMVRLRLANVNANTDIPL